ncbi:RNA-binding (RRM/RBD/RNP motifs) family protein [Striga asiatica]|uniref:RNA-binding (RRM/RBD/RNP motifs) family protein n=1 Tax=Striga asiatica TaxID=4170 RepID=A0A5A7PW46_STRAF|nr:RNA-binding (RRM/RBD/RNP motifs) family protein [Striga asiatica]
MPPPLHESRRHTHRHGRQNHHGCGNHIHRQSHLDRTATAGGSGLRFIHRHRPPSHYWRLATRGLNAALSEKGNINNNSSKRYSLSSSSSSSSTENAENSRLKAQSRMSLGGRRSFSSSSDAEIPSLDKFLVKRLTRLERDVLEAKNARKKAEDEKKLIISSDEKVPDLGSVLVKHASKLEKEVEGAKTGDNRKIQRGPRVNQDFSEVLPSLDKYLVKHLTRLEREVEEEKNGEKTASFSTEKNGKENVDTNKTENKDMGSKVCRKGDFSSYGESLDKVLVKKHVSKLEKEKLSFCGDEEMRIIKPKSKAESSEGSLDQVLVKHKSRFH